jgi:hypothetical protein
MKKILFCLISIALLSTAVLAAAKIDLFKPYTLTRKQWLQTQLDIVSSNFMAFNRILVTTEVLDDKITVAYTPIEETNMTYNEEIAQQEQLLTSLRNAKNKYTWAKDLSVEIKENQSTSEK